MTAMRRAITLAVVLFLAIGCAAKYEPWAEHPVPLPAAHSTCDGGAIVPGTVIHALGDGDYIGAHSFNRKYDVCMAKLGWVRE